MLAFYLARVKWPLAGGASSRRNSLGPSALNVDFANVDFAFIGCQNIVRACEIINRSAESNVTVLFRMAGPRPKGGKTS
jgi:hypothetical protein